MAYCSLFMVPALSCAREVLSLDGAGWTLTLSPDDPATHRIKAAGGKTTGPIIVRPIMLTSSRRMSSVLSKWSCSFFRAFGSLISLKKRKTQPFDEPVHGRRV